METYIHYNQRYMNLYSLINEWFDPFICLKLSHKIKTQCDICYTSKTVY